MAEKRKVLKQVGKPSFSKSDAIEIIRRLREERMRRQRKQRTILRNQ